MFFHVSFFSVENLHIETMTFHNEFAIVFCFLLTCVPQKKGVHFALSSVIGLLCYPQTCSWRQ